MRLHNSLTRQVEDFVPGDPRRVTMYVCGPTVYDTPHLGNARPAVVFDVLHRLLRERFPEVVYARNLTDVDDKIIDRARESGEPIDALTARTTAQYHAATAALGVMPPTHEPRATASIPAIIEMIGRLVATGHAYEAEGHVLFELASDPSHGELAGHDVGDLRAGHRVAVASYKRAPGDFVLWKPSSDAQPGWDSPWGRGRPGWHIECSAMIRSTFEDPTIDIHGGGADLRFPHHEAEMSQSRCANHAPLARYWVHNGMLLVGGSKMSKSAGNFLTVDDALSTRAAPVVRLALLWAHYAQPLNWTDQVLDEAASALATWHASLDGVEGPPERGDASERVLSALGSDLNTPLAFARMHELARELRSAVGPDRARLASGLRHAGSVLGLDLSDNEGYLRGDPGPAARALLARREAARSSRDWAASDMLRSELAALGIEVRDGKSGTTWSWAQGGLDGR